MEGGRWSGVVDQREVEAGEAWLAPREKARFELRDYFSPIASTRFRHSAALSLKGSRPACFNSMARSAALMRKIDLDSGLCPALCTLLISRGKVWR